MKVTILAILRLCKDDKEPGPILATTAGNLEDEESIVEELFSRVGIDIHKYSKSQERKTSSENWWTVEPCKRYCVHTI